jgi:glycosyltransferase involved in cell wall biosynthesis
MPRQHILHPSVRDRYVTLFASHGTHHRFLPLPHSGGQRPKLVFLVTEDWYFYSHRLPVARAARDAGFDVIVATRVRDHGAQIIEEGFALRPLPWRRRGGGVVGAVRAIVAIARLYRAEQPEIVHHVALKPVLFGSFARALAFGRTADKPAVIDAVMGLGSGFAPDRNGVPLRRLALGVALRAAVARSGSQVIVQNPEDGAALAALGVEARRISLIRGSGVDTRHFVPLPMPAGETVRVALVSRMLYQKGVLEAVAAIRLLRAQGVPVELILAGPTDKDNSGSLSQEALVALAAELGVSWLGPVEDVREVWDRAAIALLPSTYGEGVPKALLEAAACARPIVASDMPGCREAVRTGTDANGILVPPRDVRALADAIAELANDPGRCLAMGRNGRALIEAEFAEEIVARATLALYRQALARSEAGR